MTREEILGLLPKADTAEAIREAIDLHQKKHAECLNLADSLEERQQAQLLELSTEELLGMERQAAELRLDSDRLSKQLSLLLPKLVAAERREAKAALNAQLAEVECKNELFRQAMRTIYPEAAAQVAHIMVLEQEALAAAAEYRAEVGSFANLKLEGIGTPTMPVAGVCRDPAIWIFGELVQLPAPDGEDRMRSDVTKPGLTKLNGRWLVTSMPDISLRYRGPFWWGEGRRKGVRPCVPTGDLTTRPDWADEVEASYELYRQTFPNGHAGVEAATPEEARAAAAAIATTGRIVGSGSPDNNIHRAGGSPYGLGSNG